MATAFQKAASNRSIHTSPEDQKEIYEHFKPLDLKMLGAYIKGYQRMGHTTNRVEIKDMKAITVTSFEPAPFFENAMSHTKRPWTVYERFMMAVRTFTEKKKTFTIATFDIATGRLSSKQILSKDDLAQSQILYENIMNWDEQFLDSMVKEYGPAIEKLGFEKLKKGEFAPMDVEKDKSDMEMALEEANAGRRILTPAEGEDPTINQRIIAFLANGPAKRTEVVDGLVQQDANTNPNSVNANISRLVKDGALKADKDTGTVSLAQ